MPKMKTYVYVDGFNLYYGCLKGTPYRWLDIRKMCQAYLPNSELARIYYFTAIVSGTGTDPDKHLRQRAYLRALKTTGVDITLGHFLTERISMRRADGLGDVEVMRSKEKGSDVNLATQLMWDAAKNHFEAAAVVSGDLDFIAPVNAVRDRYAKEIGILDPQRTAGTRSQLYRAATFIKPIRPGVLANCQLPNIVTDDKGDIHKPGDWY